MAHAPPIRRIRLAVIGTAAALTLYILSTGPVFRIAHATGAPSASAQQALHVAYAPLSMLSHSSAAAQTFFEWWIGTVWDASGVKRATTTQVITQSSACSGNLRQIDTAKHVWALENRRTDDSEPAWEDLTGNTRYMPAVPQCPSGGTYTLHAVSAKPTCSVTGHKM
jgi:hypothetical protein